MVAEVWMNVTIDVEQFRIQTRILSALLAKAANGDRPAINVVAASQLAGLESLCDAIWDAIYDQHPVTEESLIDEE